MNTIYQSILNLFPTLLGDVTPHTGAGPATSPTGSENNSWNTFFLRVALPYTLPVLPISYGVYKLFTSRAVTQSAASPISENSVKAEEFVNRDVKTEKEIVLPKRPLKDTQTIYAAKDWRVTVANDGSVTIRNIEPGLENSSQITIKPGDTFRQGENLEYFFTLKNEGGLHLEGKHLYTEEPFIIPLRTDASKTTDLIRAQFKGTTVTEIPGQVVYESPKEFQNFSTEDIDVCEAPAEPSRTSKEFRQAPTMLEINIPTVTLERNQLKKDLTKANPMKAQTKAVEASRGYESVEAVKTTEFKGREEMKTGKFKVR